MMPLLGHNDSHLTSWSNLALWCKVLVDGGMAKVTTLAQDDQWIMHEMDPK